MVKTNDNKGKQLKGNSSREEEKTKSKRIVESDSSSEEELEEAESEDEDIMDPVQWKKFLHKMFPSKHAKKELQRAKDAKSPKGKKNIKKSKKRIVESESEDDEEEDEEDANQAVNIVLSIDPKSLRRRGKYDEEDDEYDDEDYDSEEDSDYEDEDEDEEDYEEDEDEDEEEEEEDEEEEEEEVSKKNDVMIDFEKEEKLLAELHEIQKNNVDSMVIRDAIKISEKKLKTYKKNQEKKDNKVKTKNSTRFRELISNKKNMNDFVFFKSMPIQEQTKILTEVEEINKIISVDKPYRISLLESDMPTHFKACAMKKINMLRYMEPGGGEFYKVKNWIDTFMKIPFGVYHSLPVSRNDGIEACHNFMENAKNILDEAVYGLNDAKMQIMQMVGQLSTNPKAIGSAIAIKGPMGTGKTTLVKEGISKILGREFAFIALGGATDSSFLEGHSYTYEGSTWGQIVDILMKSKCMNPVIYFDELDKVSDTPKGEEIIGILTHLTDTSQNSEYHDKYFSEINFDLSKCMFIFSYNDESKVNPILRDRMYRIQTKGYETKEKKIICDKHLLPKIRDEVKFSDDEIIFEDDVIEHIIENYTNKEDGMRNLKRCMEIIYTKLNLYRLMKPETNLFETEMSLKVEFPFKVTKDIVDKLIKLDKKMNPSLHMLYI